jgi:3-deoxy-D-manno-octulosonic-acid transferase
MRFLYTLVWILALPLVLARLFWRGRKEPGYRDYIAERFGIYPPLSDSASERSTIWLHAVSVGETRAAEPLIRQLIQVYPRHQILLTHMTPTGRATGAALFNAEIANRTILQHYLPYDVPFFVASLITHFQPSICILMETEVWPNLIHTCRKHRVPVALVNARLSAKSLRKAERLSSLILPASASISCVAAQTEADAQRIRQLGAPAVEVTGNSKFDVTIPAEKVAAGLALRRQWGNRPILLCASTREGEEGLILDAYSTAQIDELLLIIVPRHPQRFDSVEQEIRRRGLAMARRTGLADQTLPTDVRVVLGDTMGEMISYYASCDIAFIGGSLLPLGGQNLIEACAVQKPVLIGQHTFNFEAISEDAISARAALRIDDANQLFVEAQQLFTHPEIRNAMGDNAVAFANQHRGATARTMALLEQYIRD